MMYWQNKNILLTGGSGFLGSHVYEALLSLGVAEANLHIPSSTDYDLRDKKACQAVVKDKNIVIHFRIYHGIVPWHIEC